MIDMFLDIPGIPGESVNEVHRNEIDVLAYSIGFSSAGDTRGSKPVAQNLSVTVYYSKASPPLFSALCAGTVFAKVTLSARIPGPTPREFLTLTLEQVIVTSDSHGGSGGEDRPTQNFTFAFARISYAYVGAGAGTGEVVPPVRAGFDFEKLRPIGVP